MSERLARMVENPRAGWTITDIEAVCAEFRIDCKPRGGGGSHCKVSHPLVTEILTIPFKRPIKPVYIRKLVSFVEAVRAAQ